MIINDAFKKQLEATEERYTEYNAEDIFQKIFAKVKEADAQGETSLKVNYTAPDNISDGNFPPIQKRVVSKLEQHQIAVFERGQYPDYSVYLEWTSGQFGGQKPKEREVKIDLRTSPTNPPSKL